MLLVDCDVKFASDVLQFLKKKIHINYVKRPLFLNILIV